MVGQTHAPSKWWREDGTAPPPPFRPFPTAKLKRRSSHWLGDLGRGRRTLKAPRHAHTRHQASTRATPFPHMHPLCRGSTQQVERTANRAGFPSQRPTWTARAALGRACEHRRDFRRTLAPSLRTGVTVTLNVQPTSAAVRTYSRGSSARSAPCPRTRVTRTPSLCGRPARSCTNRGAWVYAAFPCKEELLSCTRPRARRPARSAASATLRSAAVRLHKRS